MSRLAMCLALTWGIIHANSSAPTFAAGPEELPTSPAGQSSGQPAGEASESGWLKPNLSADQTHAPYALVDRWGMVTAHVAPNDEIDLSRFVNRQVRVRGRETGQPNQMRVLDIDEISASGSQANRPAAPRRNNRVQQAAYQQGYTSSGPEELPAQSSRRRDMQSNRGLMSPERNAPANEEGDYSDDAGYDSAWGDPQGDAPGCGSCGGGFCGPPGVVWVRAEYLYWWTKGMDVPPLVTSGPSVQQPGFLGEPDTQILFGGGLENTRGRSGGRITLGSWLNCAQTIGVEGDYFALASVTTNYSATSTGDPILSRPFFDVRPSLAAQNVEQVASPGNLQGTVSVSVPTQFQGAGVALRFNLCCSDTCGSCYCLPSMNGPGWYRLDFLLGYRYARLSDGVSVNENLVSINTQLPGTFVVNDSFHSRTVFNGVELGTAMMTSRGRWSLEAISKLALGNSNERVTINGSTITTQSGTSTTDAGGLLAQTSNIGTYRHNQFAVIPQLGLNLGYQIAPRWRAIVGYTFFYWSQVARAGDQIDTDVNSTLLPNSPNPPTGDLRHPQFVLHQTDFWAQGINAGLDFRW